MRTVDIILVVVAVIGIIWWRHACSGVRIGEIGPAHMLQKKYGLYAENRPVIEIDASSVPEHLRDLIPMAEKWGIGDDIIRGDYVEKATEEDKQQFAARLKGRTFTVEVWVHSFESGQMSEAAVHFMYMLIALDESGSWPDQKH